jgi:outer membrane lipoprotein-sorting protein
MIVSKFLRTTSTRRLIGTFATLVAVIAGGTAIAVAAAGRGPVPPARPLADALHGALSAPAPAGISARISFTNGLIASSNLQGSDPLLTGATGRLWLSHTALRLELQSDNGDAQIVVKDGRFWVYDPTSRTVYEGSLPAHTGTVGTDKASTTKHDQLPTIAQIQSDISQLMGHVNLSGAIPSDVAGHAAYTVRISPRHDGGLLGDAELAWDASRGVPLRIAVYARNNPTPVLELKATDISYGAVPASDFAVTPPTGATVVRVATPAGQSVAGAARGKAGHADRAHAQVNGVAAVARHLSFPLLAPSSLVGLPRQTVTLLDWGGTPAALVSYGQNLGGIAVIEQTATKGKSALPSASNGDRKGLSLPTVSIKGATGQELDTALGTMIRFTRGNVTYTVVGSVPAAAAELAARAL